MYPYFLLETSDIENYLKPRVHNFVGVFPKDKAHEAYTLMKGKKTAYAVFNMDDSDGEGTHWTALIKKPDHYIWWDSFGAVPPKSIIRTFKPLKYNKEIYQSFTDATCGLWVIKAILADAK